MKHRLCFITLLTAALAWSAAPASAAFIITANEVGNDVVFSGSGTLNITGLTSFFSTTVTNNSITPSLPFLSMGSNGVADVYNDVGGATGFVPFGTGVTAFANSATGDLVVFLKSGNNNGLQVPTGYTSGDPLSGTSTYASRTLANLGLTPGTYVYAYGSGPNADSITLNIIPEPATVVLLGMSAVALLGRRRRR